MIPQSRSPKNEPTTEKTNYSQIMLERWVKANQILPECDKNDMLSDTTLVNGGIIAKTLRQ